MIMAQTSNARSSGATMGSSELKGTNTSWLSLTRPRLTGTPASASLCSWPPSGRCARARTGAVGGPALQQSGAFVRAPAHKHDREPGHLPGGPEGEARGPGVHLEDGGFGTDARHPVLTAPPWPRTVDHVGLWTTNLVATSIATSGAESAGTAADS